MKYYSTNHQAPVADLRKAVVKGLAEDRGLYMPEEIYKLPKAFFDDMPQLRFQDIAYNVASQFFGDDIEKANNGEGARIGTRGPRNLLELLPDEFTLDDAKRIRRQQGMSTDDKKCRQMITQWVFRKYVLQITDYSFHKSNYYGKKE